MSVIEQINQQLNKFKEKREILKKELQKEFPDLLKPLLNQSKRITSIGWKQYTPYFNDGDECVFGVRNDELSINGIDEYDDDKKEIIWAQKRIWDGKQYTDNKDYDEAEGTIIEQIEAVLKSIPDEFYKDLFGDHVTVTVSKDGSIETEEYKHD